MDLQTVFYIVSILFMVFVISILTFLIYGVMQIKRTLEETKTRVIDRPMSYIKNKPAEVAGFITLFITTLLSNKLKSVFRRT